MRLKLCHYQHIQPIYHWKLKRNAVRWAQLLLHLHFLRHLKGVIIRICLELPRKYQPFDTYRFGRHGIHTTHTLHRLQDLNDIRLSTLAMFPSLLSFRVLYNQRTKLTAFVQGDQCIFRARLLQQIGSNPSDHTSIHLGIVDTTNRRPPWLTLQVFMLSTPQTTIHP